jgi:uncharacterized protein (DUF3084 family)
MNIADQLIDVKKQLVAAVADKAKIEAIASEYKASIEEMKAKAEADGKKFSEELAKAGQEKKTAEELMDGANKKLIEAQAKVAELEAKIKLAPFGDVSEGQQVKVEAAGAAPENKPVSHLEQLNALGQFSPQGVAYYRQHEKEIHAELVSARKN